MFSDFYFFNLPVGVVDVGWAMISESTMSSLLFPSTFFEQLVQKEVLVKRRDDIVKKRQLYNKYIIELFLYYKVVSFNVFIIST